MSTELFREKKTVEYIPVKFPRNRETCLHPTSEYFYRRERSYVERVEACTRCGETDKWKLNPSGGCF